jgi:hypothetical protein
MIVYPTCRWRLCHATYQAFEGPVLASDLMSVELPSVPVSVPSAQVQRSEVDIGFVGLDSV